MSTYSADQAATDIKETYASCFLRLETGRSAFDRWLEERDRVILQTPVGQTPAFNSSLGNEIRSAYTRNFHPEHDGFRVNGSETQIELGTRFDRWLSERDQQVREAAATVRG